MLQTNCNNMIKNEALIINQTELLVIGECLQTDHVTGTHLNIIFVPMNFKMSNFLLLETSILENVLYSEVTEKTVSQFVSPAYGSWPDRLHVGNEVDRRRPM